MLPPFASTLDHPESGAHWEKHLTDAIFKCGGTAIVDQIPVTYVDSICRRSVMSRSNRFTRTVLEEIDGQQTWWY